MLASAPAFGEAPVELSADRRFAARVRRLAAVSVVGLGSIWALAVATLDAPWALDTALALGWVLMPALLAASLRRPRLRYMLVAPSLLVGVPLVAVCFLWLPGGALASAGWLSLTGGILLGGLLGLWFWFRVVPVPGALDDPFSPARWTLVGVHVGLVVAGLALAALGSV